MKNDRNLYNMMLKRFREKTLHPAINQMGEAIKQGNQNKFQQGARSLKNASGCIGAGRIHYDCFFI